MINQALQLQKGVKGPDAFQLVEIPVAPCTEQEVRVEVEAFGLNYADIMAAWGLYQATPPRPCVVGYEVVGRVVAIGEKVSAEWINQRILAFTEFGGHARYVNVPVDQLVAVKNEPAGELLALCVQGTTAYYMARELSPVQSDDIVLIHAASGGVGTLLTQLCKSAGAQVIAKVGSDDKMRLAIENGADWSVNYNKEDYAKAITHKMGKRPLTISFNAVGGSTFKKDRSLLAPGGRLFLYGGAELTGGNKGVFGVMTFLWKMGLVLPIGQLGKSQSLLGVNLLEIARNRPAVFKRCLKGVLGEYQQGSIQPLIGPSSPISEYQKVISSFASGDSSGKCVIYW